MPDRTAPLNPASLFKGDYLTNENRATGGESQVVEEKDLWAKNNPEDSSSLEMVHFAHGIKKGRQSLQYTMTVL